MVTYDIVRAPRHERILLRGLDTHVTRWGPPPTPANPPVILLHGWQDTSDTFQFMVDAFERDWPLAALDWRGFGRTQWPAEGYWFADYLADLDAFLDCVAPDGAVRLVGHSMGGNVAGLYAGLRPERVRCVGNLEGFGLPRSDPEAAPGQLRRWLDQVKSRPPLKEYDSVEQLASVIRFRYPRFSEAQAAFVATAWSGPTGSGKVTLRGDSRHRWISPLRYQREDTIACWRAATAPMLLLLGTESELLPKLGADGSESALRAAFPKVEIAWIGGAGHMLHIEQPAKVAAAIEQFFEGT